MAVKETQSDSPQQAPAATMGELVDRLSRFDGPPELFLVNLLAIQCQLASAAGGAILRFAEDRQVQVLAVYPQPQGNSQNSQKPPVWLAKAAELAASAEPSGKVSVAPLSDDGGMYESAARRNIITVPLRSAADGRGVAVYLVESGDAGVLAAARERLELTISLLGLYEMRLALQRRQADLQRLRMSMEVLAAVDEHDRFAGAAMVLCNEVASRWQCDRVGLGFHKGRYVQLKALSHTEKFSRKMKLVQDIESAMEESFDQDIETVYPPAADATYVSRSAAELSSRHGPTAVLNLPLRKAGKAIAILTLERPADQPFALDEVETLRLTCDLCIARLENLHRHDRWFGARIAGAARKGLAWLVGTKHTWAKLIVILVFAAAAFLIFAKGDYQAEAPFVLEAMQRQVVPAPFDGFLKSVAVEPGDSVEAGQSVLARLDAAELRLQLASAMSERMGHLKRAAAAMRDGKTSDAQIARADADQQAARIRLLEYHIAKADIISPVTGCVVTGNLKRQIGAPVKTGDMLFEVAPLGSLRAELSVPEDQVAEIRPGQRGELAAASYPDRRIAFVVERINPVAEVVNQRNVFKVRVRLLETQSWMRPGMEGVGKVHLGERRYVWLWTRRLTNWIRMKLWL